MPGDLLQQVLTNMVTYIPLEELQSTTVDILLLDSPSIFMLCYIRNLRQ